MSNEKVETTQFYVCRCFNTDNIYLADYNLHVRFMTEQQFRLDYQEASVRTFEKTWVLDVRLNLYILHPAAAEEARLCDRASV